MFGAKIGLGLVRRLGVGDERRGPAQVAEQVAQGVGLLELGGKLHELGQREGVREGDGVYNNGHQYPAVIPALSVSPYRENPLGVSPYSNSLTASGTVHLFIFDG